MFHGQQPQAQCKFGQKYSIYAFAGTLFADPAILESDCDPLRILRLLDFIEGNGVMDANPAVKSGPGFM